MLAFARSLQLVVCFLPLVLATEFLVGVGKDETTGKKGKGFDPSVINPMYGDIIRFEFNSGSHSVLQSSYDHPCTPLAGGYNSGVLQVSDDLPVDAPSLPSRTFLVNVTTPLWFFDDAGGLCKQGAVLAINPTADQTAPGFIANAARDNPPATTASTAAGTGSATASGTSATASHNAAVKASASFSGIGLLFLSLVGFM
ncbi:hypothetical protein AMATHDRAFT_61179 [Amanita thiersii Skay4041]|uniref:Phytocyanin domain-containing protein n=1 Tax=Amanita thiersii Skay4041 TaxID=703135 RepID=A0A2A9NRJ0_9AGAR|nr:hypothetical protein AMATHDRAFT_61179 [Amanita thiersii Skay4041]